MNSYILAVTLITFSFPNVVFGQCWESGKGKLSKGNLSKTEWKGWVTELNKNAKQQRFILFKVQQKQKYYLKLCSDPSNIQHFMQIFGDCSSCKKPEEKPEEPDEPVNTPLPPSDIDSALGSNWNCDKNGDGKPDTICGEKNIMNLIKKYGILRLEYLNKNCVKVCYLNE